VPDLIIYIVGATSCEVEDRTTRISIRCNRLSDLLTEWPLVEFWQSFSWDITDLELTGQVIEHMVAAQFGEPCGESQLLFMA